MTSALLLAWVAGVGTSARCPLSVAELTDGAEFLTHLRAPQPQPDLVNCTWYKQQTCCTAEDTCEAARPLARGAHGAVPLCWPLAY